MLSSHAEPNPAATRQTNPGHPTIRRPAAIVFNELF